MNLSSCIYQVLILKYFRLFASHSHCSLDEWILKFVCNTLWTVKWVLTNGNVPWVFSAFISATATTMSLCSVWPCCDLPVLEVSTMYTCSTCPNYVPIFCIVYCSLRHHCGYLCDNILVPTMSATICSVWPHNDILFDMFPSMIIQVCTWLTCCHHLYWNNLSSFGELLHKSEIANEILAPAFSVWKCSWFDNISWMIMQIFICKYLCSLALSAKFQSKLWSPLQCWNIFFACPKTVQCNWYTAHLIMLVVPYEITQHWSQKIP